MCNCRNIKVQTKKCYAQQIEVPIPPHMEIYRERTIKDGRKPTICIDPCILEEIQDLWDLGVITYGSCCGHNYLPPMVIVDMANAEYMLAMGYEYERTDPERKDTFQLTSVSYPVKRSFFSKIIDFFR